ICERLSSRTDFAAAKQIEQLDTFQERFTRLLNSAQDFIVRNFFRYNHRNIAGDSGKFFNLTKLIRLFLANQKKVSMHLDNEHGTRRSRFCGRQLSAETNHLIAGEDIDRQREIGKLTRAK